MDIATPRNVQLSGFYRRSNAVLNAQQKIPNCLMAISNELNSRLLDVKQQYGEDAAEELKEIITKIQSLRDEVLADVPFRKLNSSGPDVKFYNDYLEKMTCQDCRPTMLQTVRIYSECYVYRRIWECFELSKTLKKIDPYEPIKQKLFDLSIPVIMKAARYFKNILKYPSEIEKDDFEKLIKLNLWSNQGDSIMSKEFIQKNLIAVLNIKRKDSSIVCNQTDDAWKIISNRTHPSNITAFICNNVGFELFMELCLADYLYTNNYSKIIHFHVKHIPWFIFDTTEADIYCLLLKLIKIPRKYIQELGIKWESHFQAGRWKIICRKYWTLPIGFSTMRSIDPVLYKLLEDAKLVIIKGDSNYRKLLDDINWCPSTPFTKVLTDFLPSNLLLIRVMKCDVACGIPERQVEKFDEDDNNWKICGQYGLIQFVKKPSEYCDCLST